jgi:hypothetical protein
MRMTKDRAKVICRHLLRVQQSLAASAPASDLYGQRLGKLHDRLDPDSTKYSDDVAGSYTELQEIYAGLAKLQMPGRNPPTAQPAIADALEQLAKAAALLADLLPSKSTPHGSA